MTVKCLAQEHNTMSPARTRTRTTRSGVERTNHEATASFHQDSGLSETEAITSTERCNKAVRAWMLKNKLKLNEEKTEFLVIGTPQQQDKASLDEMTVGHTKVETTTAARSLGVWFDGNMKFDTNVTKICVMGHFYLYNIRRIRKYLTYESVRTLTQATIIVRLDYCNSLLYGCSDGQIKMLQRLQILAAKLICNSTRFCRITSLMFKLHWLPVKQRIKYKILLMTYKAIHGTIT